ncbi:MAG: hypothetical protein ACEQSR_00745 [Candidatus Methylacidiphilales bacterium]
MIKWIFLVLLMTIAFINLKAQQELLFTNKKTKKEVTYKLPVKVSIKLPNGKYKNCLFTEIVEEEFIFIDSRKKLYKYNFKDLQQIEFRTDGLKSLLLVGISPIAIFSGTFFLQGLNQDITLNRSEIISLGIIFGVSAYACISVLSSFQPIIKPNAWDYIITFPQFRNGRRSDY